MQITDPSNTFEITFTVDKQAALAAGKSRWGEVKVMIDPAELDETERAILATGVDRLPWTRGRPGTGLLVGSAPKAKRYAECTTETVRAAIREAGEMFDWYDRYMAERKAEAEKEQREHDEAKIAEILPGAPMSLIWGYGLAGRVPLKEIEWEVRHDLPGTMRDDPRIAPHVAEAKRLVAEHNAALVQRRKAEIQAANQRNVEAKQRRKTQIDSWVAEHGTDGQKKRHAAGLLPEGEVLDGMRDQAFACLDGFGRYEKMTAANVLDELGLGNDFDRDYNPAPDVEFSTEDASEASDDEFATLETIKAALGERAATVTLRDHIGEAVDTGRVVRKSVRVEMTVGEFTFAREYACPQ